MLTPEQKDAVQRIIRAAWECEKKTGCPAALTASQCIFESAYLTRSPGNNCFGIKFDHHGVGCQYVVTHEYVNGQYKEMKLTFEVYDSLESCFADHARLLQVGVYKPAWDQYQMDKDLDKFVRSISKFYATDPLYADKMIKEIHSTTVQSALQTLTAGA